MVIRYMQNMAKSSARRPPVPAPSQAPAGDFLGTAVDSERRRGRGTSSNASGRYEPTARVGFDDGWRSIEELPAFETTVTEEKARSIRIAAASTDASTASRARRTPTWGCRPGSILNRSCS
jgi:hypothetical protein